MSFKLRHYLISTVTLLLLLSRPQAVHRFVVAIYIFTLKRMP